MIIYLYMTIWLLLSFFICGDRCLIDFNPNRSRPQLDTFFMSESGNFMVHYDLSDENGNLPIEGDENQNYIPDYIELVADVAEESRALLINTMGYLEEPDDGDGIHDIYIKNQGVWGKNTVENSITGASYTTIDNDYQFFSNYCTSPIQKMKVSVAHEYFHAVQRAYRPNPFSDHDFLLEMTSMWFEDVIYDDCNDYLAFTYDPDGIFSNVTQKFDGSDSSSQANFGYSMALFAHYLSRIIDEEGLDSQFNSTIIRRIWQNYSTGMSARDAIISTIEQDFNDSFARAWSEFISRSLFCGHFPYFNESMYYHKDQQLIMPINFSDINSTIIYPNTNNSYDLSIDPYSATISKFVPYSDIFIETIFPINVFKGYNIVKSFNGGIIDYIDSNLYIDNIDNGDLYYIVLTSLQSSQVSTEVLIKSDKNEITIYPNPIFSGNELILKLGVSDINSSLRIDIYDVLGRKISSLKIDDLQLGINYFNLKTDDYLNSSGVYFLKVFQNKKEYSSKIVFVKN
ncbi:MAG: hypothetical protein CMG00_04310 [Candidatus Marinimicrobia bacterium]|nr:hypothetical protein [Candidatus Neomarinimicrobiota bacterium]|tara:strand:- start:167 stop:1705 length:1539 start_codon:yes stop_codon:yes gene_type:complete